MAESGQQEFERPQQREEAASQHSTLGVQVGEDYWLVDMTDVSEILPLPALTAVPLTRPWYCGVANIHGNLYSISDLAVFQGHAATPREGQSRVLLVHPGFACNAGLLVTRVLGLRDTAKWRRDDMADGECYCDEQGQTWRKLDIAGLLQQAEFLRIGT